MPFINDNVFDSGLSWAKTHGSQLYICSADPGSNYTSATSTFALGSKTGISVGTPTNNTPDGRKVIVDAITDGAVTATGTATHWALTNNSSVVIASGALSGSVAVTQGSTFTLNAIDIAIRDAA